MQSYSLCITGYDQYPLRGEREIRILNAKKKKNGQMAGVLMGSNAFLNVM